jgi:hypothetical protein
MLYSDLSLTAQKQAEYNVLNLCGDERLAAEALAENTYLFDMDGNVIEKNDNY